MGKSVKLLAVMLASFAVTVFLFRRQNSDPGTWVTVLFLMLLVCVPFAFSSVGEFIRARPRAVFSAGIALIVGGIAAMLGLFFVSSYYGFPRGITGTDPISMATMWIMMSGIAVALMPRSMASLKRTEKAQAERTARTNAAGPLDSAFNGVRAARAAIAETIHKWPAFLRLFGPWVVLLWAVPIVGIHVAAFHNGLTTNVFDTPAKVDRITEFFGDRLPLIVVCAFAIPIALVSWHRHLLLRGTLAFGWRVPGDTIRYFWRLWTIMFMLSVLLRLIAGNAPDLARVLRVQDTLFVAEVMYWSVLCVGIYLASSFALVLPAVATGNRDFVGTDSVRATKPLGNSYRLGFMLSFLPFAVAWWGTEMLLRTMGMTGPKQSIAAYSLALVPNILLFLALASCATYLSRVYAMQLHSAGGSAAIDTPATSPSLIR